MKEIVAGGFLGLYGILGLIPLCFFASANMVDSWYGSRLLTTILHSEGYTFVFFLSLLFLVLGLVLIFWGVFQRENGSCTKKKTYEDSISEKE